MPVNLPKFIKISWTNYTAIQTKDENALYFIYDATSKENCLFLGSKSMGLNFYEYGADLTHTTRPASGKVNTIYYNADTKVASMWNGAAFKDLGVAKNSNLSTKGDGTAWGDAPTDDGTVPTSLAAKSYADNVASTAETNAKNASLPKMANDTTANKVLLSVAGGASVAASSKGLGGSTLTNTGTTQEPAYSADTLATEAAVAAAANGAESAAKTYADDNKIAKLSLTAASNGNIATIASAGGAISDSGKTIGGSTLSGTTVSEVTTYSADKLATEAAVAAFVKAAEDRLSGNISGLGDVFNFKGIITLASNQSESDALATKSATAHVGDVWLIGTKEFVYVSDGEETPTYHWEELGTPIDLSGYATKVNAADENEVLIADSNGNMSASGKTIGGNALTATTADNVTTYDGTKLATEKAVAAYADSVASAAETAAKNASIPKIASANGGKLVVSVNDGTVAESSYTAGGSTFTNTNTSGSGDPTYSATTLATEAGVAAQLSDLNTNIGSDYVPKFSGTNDYVALVSNDGTNTTKSVVKNGYAIQRQGSADSVPTLSADDDKLASNKVIKAYADGKIAKVTGETGEVPKFTADGSLESTGYTIGGTSSFAADPSSTNAPTEAAIAATFAWQDLTANS